MRPWEVADQTAPQAPISEDRRMVWAIDEETQWLVHIGELPASRRGKMAKCACCYCSASLTAVNAATEAELRSLRPHFRHPKGTERDSCMIVSARHAAMNLFLQEGLIDLPARRHRVTLHGLSGVEHHGLFEHAPERVSVAGMRFIDTTQALLTLGDGRELVVLLVAKEETNLDGHGAAIQVVLDDSELATLDREELRQRIRPLLNQAVWLRCWPQEVDGATADAIQKADGALDWWSGPEEDVPADLRGETLLHREAKRILADAKRIRVPELHLSAPDGQDTYGMGWMASQAVELVDVVLEKRVGGVRPDLMATLQPHTMLGSELLIEITVTNGITEERRQRIKAENLPCLEIDLRAFAGRVNRDQLADILCQQIDGKTWIHHPRLYVPSNDQEASAPIAHIPDEAELLSLPETDLIQGWYNAWFAASEQGTPENKQVLDAWSRVLLGKRINLRLAHDDLYGKNLLSRLYKIRKWHTEGTADAMRSLAQLVMNICSDVSVGNWQFRPVYLAVLNRYSPSLSANQALQLSAMREKVRSDIRQGNHRPYIWAKDHDDLLLRLFPDLKTTISFIRSLPPPLSMDTPSQTKRPTSAVKTSNSKDDYQRRRG